MSNNVKFLLWAFIGVSVHGITPSPIVPDAEPNLVFRKDYILISELDAFYKVHTIKLNFSDAVATCLAEGTQLLIPSGKEELRAINNFTKPAINKYFIGIHDIYAEGIFVPIDGRRSNEIYLNWAVGEPNDNQNAEDCVLAYRDGTYNDGNCENKEFFVCKINVKDMAPRNVECDTNIPGYVYRPDLNSCYKFHKIPIKWHDAYRTCEGEEADLVIINSESEAKMLTEEFAKYPEHKLLGNFQKILIFIGFTDLLREGVYVTTQGQNLMDTGYSKWGNNQPDSHLGEEDCGSMFRDGTLNDINCECRAMYVCEKKIADVSAVAA